MKKNKALFLIGNFLIYALINLIVFLTVKDARLDSAAFWISWSFAIPVSFVVNGILVFWCFSEKKPDVARIILPLKISAGFSAIYLIVGLIFMYFDIQKTTFLIILEVIISVFFILFAIYAISAIDYISGNLKKTAAKVLYIRMLEADIKDCSYKTQNANNINLLNKLAQDCRFSDPMSHASLAGIEAEISATVGKINSTLTADANADITELVNTAAAQLKSRNSRCLMLK